MTDDMLHETYARPPSADRQLTWLHRAAVDLIALALHAGDALAARVRVPRARMAELVREARARMGKGPKHP